MHYRSISLSIEDRTANTKLSSPPALLSKAAIIEKLCCYLVEVVVVCPLQRLVGCFQQLLGALQGFRASRQLVLGTGRQEKDAESYCKMFEMCDEQTEQQDQHTIGGNLRDGSEHMVIHRLANCGLVVLSKPTIQ